VCSQHPHALAEHTHRRGGFRWRTSSPHRTRWTARKLRTETSGSHGNFRIAQNPLDCTYFLLNGEYQPTLSLTSGGWKRLRLVQSAHQSAFRFDIAGCGVALRGVAVQHVTRMVTSAP
jgi:hypothetical protein